MLHETTKLLYTNHRLAVQSGKTYIQPTEAFIRQNLNDPRWVFEGEIEERLEELIDQLNEESSYEQLTIDDVSEERVDEQVKDCLESLFRASLRATPIRFGTIRFVFVRPHAGAVKEWLRSLSNTLDL